MNRTGPQPALSKVTRLSDFAAAASAILRDFGVLRAIVFGSFARGEATRHSDVDMLVVWQLEKRFFDRHEGLIWCTARCRYLGRDIDLLIYTPQELEQMQQRTFIKDVLREGVVIYERQP